MKIKNKMKFYIILTIFKNNMYFEYFVIILYNIFYNILLYFSS